MKKCPVVWQRTPTSLIPPTTDISDLLRSLKRAYRDWLNLVKQSGIDIVKYSPPQA
jgi:hypothetical protein